MIITILGIFSIAVGLFSFGLSYLTVMKGRPAKVAWGWGILGVLCLTLIPVVLAVFFAASMSG